MNETLRIRTEAAVVALEALIEKQAVGVPWHFGCQIRKLRDDHGEFAEVMSDPDPTEAERLCPDAILKGEEIVIPWRPGELEFFVYCHQLRAISAFRRISDRLKKGPIMRQPIAAAVSEFDSLLADLDAEAVAIRPSFLDNHCEYYPHNFSSGEFEA